MNKDINSKNMLPLGTILKGTYRVDRYLASGGFGNTYMVTHTLLGSQMAMKEFFMSGITQRDDASSVSVSNADNKALFQEQLDKFRKEAIRIFKLDNDHIVKVTDLFEENGTAYYVMDFIDGESLSSLIRRTGQPISDELALNYIGQTLDALECVHAHRLYHLDIKPANIMISKDGVAKLIDFGASKQYVTVESGATESTGLSHTPGYAPTEVISQNFQKIGPWSDLYSLGATLYNLVTAKKPPVADDIISEGSEAFSCLNGHTNQVISLVYWMMNLNYKSRPQSVQEVKERLAHPLKDQVIEYPKAVAEDEEPPIEVVVEEPAEAVTEKPVSAPKAAPVKVADKVPVEAPKPTPDGAATQVSDKAPKASPVSAATQVFPKAPKKASVDSATQVSPKAPKVAPVRPVAEAPVQKPEPISIQPEPKPEEGKSKKTIYWIIAVVAFVVAAILAFALSGNSGKSVGSGEVSDSVSTAPVAVKSLKLKLKSGECTYTGTINPADSLPDGEGEAVYENGNSYKGDFSHGLREDKDATFKYKNGDVFKGSFVNDKMKEGKYTFAKDKNYYVGTITYDGNEENLCDGIEYDKSGKVVRKWKNGKEQ